MKVVAFAGGTGSAKFIRGLDREFGEFTVIANVADNIWMHGLYVCPDIDIVVYTLSGIVDIEKGWGIREDTFRTLEQLSRLGEERWFGLGDKDLALHIMRTRLLREGKTLTQITKLVTQKLGVKQRILPATDQHVETHIITNEGEMHLQEFWVKKKSSPSVKGVRYVGAELAEPSEEVIKEIRTADKIIFCPANPITSIMPILFIRGMKEIIKSSRAVKIALSPMRGEGAFSGPATKLMRSLDHEVNSIAIAKLYSSLIDKLVIDESDRGMSDKIERLGIESLPTSILMEDEEDEKRLARFLIEV
jgi:LPPG:FO 2-phospho-L-lactate transferase